MKRFRYLAPLVIAVLFVVPVFAAESDYFPTAGGEGEGLTLSKVVGLITDTINVFLGLAVTLAIAMIVYGGLKMAMSRGNDAEFGKAKGILTNAIIGLVVILSVGLIVATISDFAVSPTSILR